ncbi:unnamed protein product [Diatraea saccharalis]|uniref:Protein SON n=1 Tax=Diatraea saccharalis TaxID=40085 RepID=A0A9P0C887_9NEOP|nr:unnamed protein product [Diatraea saccharalis]
MTSLINKIELLIKREKTTPEKKPKDDSTKSSSEILSELFGAFNADPPKIEDISSKKSKKSKRKHKKEKKKRSRSSSSSSTDSDSSDYSHKRKKRKKSKSKKRRDDLTPTYHRSQTPILIKPDPEPKVKSEKLNPKKETVKKPKEETTSHIKKEVKSEPNNEQACIKSENSDFIDASLIPMPESPTHKLDESDLRYKLDNKKNDDNDKAKGKIQIKNLKFSAVFEETVKKAEEEARKKAEKYEEGEYTDSSSESVKEVVDNAQFPKSSDLGGILKQQVSEEIKTPEEDKSSSKKTSSKHVESSHKSSRKERDKSKERGTNKSHKRSRSKSRRSRSRSASRRHRSSRDLDPRRRSRSRHRSRSRRRSRSRGRPRHPSPRHRERERIRRSRSPTGVKLADSEKKRLLEVARRNAINMLKNGAVPAGAAALPPHTRSQVMAAIQSGGKSVDELTDFCKHLSKKEALGELSSVSSNDEDMSENEDTIAFHHPFLVKEKAPIVMNIRGGAPLPIKTTTAVVNKEELRLQFPVSSGSQHREKASEWVPVSPPKKDMQVAKLNSTNTKPTKTETPAEKPKEPLALPAPPPKNAPAYLTGFTSGSQLTSVPAALPAPGPQAYPPGVDPPTIVSLIFSMIHYNSSQYLHIYTL